MSVAIPVEKIKKKWPELVQEVAPAFFVFIANFIVTGWFMAWAEGMHFLKGLVDGPWWGIVSATTTGYGDIYPDTILGRWIAVWLFISSIFLLAYIQATMTKVMVEDPHLYSHEEQERDEALAEWDHNLTLAVLNHLGIDSTAVKGYARYDKALKACKKAEEDKYE